MRLCLLCHPHKKFTNKGWYTHMARMHKGVIAGTVKINGENADFQVLASVPCPHPFCKEVLTEAQVQAHLESQHPDWKRGDGRYVFEVAEEYNGTTD